jgi:hypothetical protein
MSGLVGGLMNSPQPHSSHQPRVILFPLSVPMVCVRGSGVLLGDCMSAVFTKRCAECLLSVGGGYSSRVVGEGKYLHCSGPFAAVDAVFQWSVLLPGGYQPMLLTAQIHLCWLWDGIDVSPTVAGAGDFL